MEKVGLSLFSTTFTFFFRRDAAENADDDEKVLHCIIVAESELFLTISLTSVILPDSKLFCNESRSLLNAPLLEQQSFPCSVRSVQSYRIVKQLQNMEILALLIIQ